MAFFGCNPAGKAWQSCPYAVERYGMTFRTGFRCTGFRSAFSPASHQAAGAVDILLFRLSPIAKLNIRLPPPQSPPESSRPTSDIPSPAASSDCRNRPALLSAARSELTPLGLLAFALRTHHQQLPGTSRPAINPGSANGMGANSTALTGWRFHLTSWIRAVLFMA